MKRWVSWWCIFSLAAAVQAANFTSVIDGPFMDTPTWDLGSGYPNLTGPDNALVTNRVTFPGGSYTPGTYGDFNVRGGSVLTLDKGGVLSNVGSAAWIRIADQAGGGMLDLRDGLFHRGIAGNFAVGGFAAGARGTLLVGDGVGSAGSAVFDGNALQMMLGANGAGATGIVVVAADGLVTNLGNLSIGNNADSWGEFYLSGGQLHLANGAILRVGGNQGSGLLAATNASIAMSKNYNAIGDRATSTGLMVLAGSSSFSNTAAGSGNDQFYVGDTGSGSLWLRDTARFVSQPRLYLAGWSSTITGEVRVSDNAYLRVNDEVWVGRSGVGSLVVEGSGVAEFTAANAIWVAQQASGRGIIQVRDSGLLTNGTSGTIGIGDNGMGFLTVSNNGRVIFSAAGVRIGNNAGSAGAVQVSDSGFMQLHRGWVGYAGTSTGLLSATGNGRIQILGNNFFAVGENGPGAIVLSGNASMSGAMGNLAIGAQNGGRGSVTLTDFATLTNTANTTLGNNAGASGSYGMVRVADNAFFHTSGNTVLGQVAGATGELFLASSGAAYRSIGALSLAPAAGGVGWVHAEAGLLQVNAGIAGGAGTAMLNLGGATLRAGGNGHVTAPVTLTGTNGDATIDTGIYTLSFQGPVGGPAGLTKSGAGKMAMNGPGTFTGQVTVTAGRFGGTGTLAAAVALADGTFLDNNNAGIGGMLTLGGLNLAAGTTIDATFPGTNPAILVNGPLVTAGTNRVNVTGSISVGTYEVIRFPGTMTGAPTNFVLGSLPPRVLAALNPQSTGAVYLTVSGVDRIKWTGAQSDAWDLDATTNWNTESAAVPTTYLAGDLVVCDDTAAGSTTINVASAVSPTAVVVSNDARGYRIAGAPVSTVNLTKRGGELLELTASNSIVQTTVEAGTLRLLANTALGGGAVTLGGPGGGTNGVALLVNGGRSVNSPVSVTPAVAGGVVMGHDTQGGAGYTEWNGSIALQRDVILSSGNNNDRMHFGGVISGTGQVTFAGGSRITASGNNTFVGNVLITGTGTVFQTFGGDSIPNAADVDVGSGATFQVYTSEAIDALTGSGIVQPVAANPNLTVGAGGGSGVFTGLIRNNGANYIDVTKSGAGTQVFNTVHTYTGQTTVNGGLLRLDVARCFTNGGARVEAGGTLDLGGFEQAFAYLASSAPGGTVTNSGTSPVLLTLNQVFGANRDFYGAIDGDITLLVTTGNNTTAQSLSGFSSYRGGTIVRDGQLRVFQDASLGEVPAGVQATNVVLDGGTLQNFNSTFTLAATRGIFLTTNGGRFFVGWSATNVMEVAGPVSGPGALIKSDGATLSLAGSNTFSGDTILSVPASGFGPGTIRLAHSHALQNSTFDATGVGGNGTLDLNGLDVVLGGLKGSGAIFSNFTGRLTVGGNGQTTTFSGSLPGSGSLIKQGTGALTLAGTNSYLGTTEISNGTLVVQGALTSTDRVSVATGATLTGQALLSGSVTNDGTLAPGAGGVGDILCSGDLDLGPTSVVQLEIGGTAAGQFDTVQFGGNGTLAGQLSVSLVNGYVPSAGDFMLIVNGGSSLTGTFASTNLPALPPGLAWDILYVSPAVILQVVTAPIGGYDLYAGQITNGTQRGYADDPDGDGYVNLLEYVTGASPTNADAIARLWASTTNGRVALRFLRNTNAVDAQIVVEGADSAVDAAVWSGIATNFGGSWGAGTNVLETGASSPVDVFVYDQAPATNRFLRLRVVRP